MTGSGVVIEGKRILTNSHVVNHASQIFVQPDKSSEKHSASVEVLAPGIDLAVLKLDDDSVFDAHPALPLSSKVPALQQTIFVYGYPEGGSELSITRGIVSRVEFTQYYLSVEGLRVQVDAAINPGNSGGPAVVDGKLVGIAFSKLQQSDNIGYIIPAEEIELFLADVKDGRYDGKPVLEIDIQKLENDALRARFKLEKKAKGVLVRRVRLGDAGYPLKVGDVITKIGEHAIDNAGMVSVDGDRHGPLPVPGPAADEGRTTAAGRIPRRQGAEARLAGQARGRHALSLYLRVGPLILRIRPARARPRPAPTSCARSPKTAARSRCC